MHVRGQNNIVGCEKGRGGGRKSEKEGDGERERVTERGMERGGGGESTVLWQHCR